MNRITFGERVIASAGYDAQKELMEVEFTRTRQIRQFVGVQEDIWYGLKNSEIPDRYFQRNIRGRYAERNS
ncbi:MAG: KTSC domain-containing protein [Lachnospiraceae bacterium]|nr:KTSC domain-containing protein [Lachnospiraceae bacterium]